LTHPYVQAWREFVPSLPPFLPDGDDALRGVSFLVQPSPSDAGGADGQQVAEDSSFHLGLLPQPFHGRVEDARIYVLMLNPGYKPRDYTWESGKTGYRDSLVEGYSGRTPMLFLNPTYAEHPGYRWWWVKSGLRHIVQRLARSRAIAAAEAQREVALKLAAVELLPYHSRRFRHRELLGELRSVVLARQFIHEYVLPRAHQGECGVVVARGNWGWNLKETDNVVVYSGAEPVSAHLGPNTRGGKLILHLLGAE